MTLHRGSKMNFYFKIEVLLGHLFMLYYFEILIAPPTESCLKIIIENQKPGCPSKELTEKQCVRYNTYRLITSQARTAATPEKSSSERVRLYTLF